MKSIFTQLKNKLNYVALTFLLGSAGVAQAQVMINEYSCSNLSTYLDNFGGYEDWIELYNAGGTSVSLSGYHLSDNKTNVTKWTFGAVNIPANGFVRVWASGHNVTTGANLHTNFSLTQCKPDMIVLANASGTILDSLTLQRTKLGHSRGRTTNGAATWSVFLTPTPNNSNNTATANQTYVTTPAMSVGPGFYAGAQVVTLTCPDPNTTIRYTTNGSTPNGGSTAYSTPINISTTTVLRAVAFSSTANTPASFVSSNTYFINSPHTVNVISIFGDQLGTLMNGTQINPEVGVEYFDSSKTFRTEGYGQANKHGNDSWSYPQRGIDFICFDEYGYNYALQHRFFEPSSRVDFQHLIFKAAANDNYPFECPAAGNPNAWGDPTLFDGAHIRDSYVHVVAQKAGMHVDVRSWAPMIMYVNGAYWGVYDLREKVDDKDFCNYYHNASADSLQFLKNWGGITVAYGGTQANNDWNTTKNYITTNNMAVQANYNHADSLLSVKSLVDYMLINSYCVTSDWLNWNSEWWRGTNASSNKKKWRYAIWDEDATFHHYINYTGIPNQNANASPCDPQTLNPNPPDYGGNIDIWNSLMANPGFQQYYILRYYDLVNSGLSCTRMTQILDSMIAVITPEMQGQITKWGGSIAAWQTNVLNLRNFIIARCDSITTQFDNCYNVTGPYVIKVNVDPPNSGTVDFSTNHLTNFVWQGLYPGNIDVNISETPNPNYCFDHWEFKNHTPLPSTTSQSVTVHLMMTDSIVAHFIYNGPPTVTPANPQVCAGQTVTLTGSNGQNFTWSPPTGLSCTSCTSTVATVTASTTYTLTANNAPGCSNTNTVTITIAPPQPPLVIPVNPSICPGQTVALTASQGANFTWAPPTGLSCTSCTTTIASPTVNTTYTVTQTAVPGCTSSRTVTVTIMPNAIAGFTSNPLNNSLPEQVQFVSTSTLSTGCSWDFGGGITSNSCTPTMTYTMAGTYTVTLIAQGTAGCNDTITKILVIADTAGLIMPNVFSPNGDGINDYFQPISKNVGQFSCTVFDRWGKIVFDFKSATDKWMGQSMNGGICPDGTYYYVMDAKDDRGKSYNAKGFITLNR